MIHRFAGWMSKFTDLQEKLSQSKINQNSLKTQQIEDPFVSEASRYQIWQTQSKFQHKNTINSPEMNQTVFWHKNHKNFTKVVMIKQSRALRLWYHIVGPLDRDFSAMMINKQQNTLRFNETLSNNTQHTITRIKSIQSEVNKLQRW